MNTHKEEPLPKQQNKISTSCSLLWDQLCKVHQDLKKSILQLLCTTVGIRAHFTRGHLCQVTGASLYVSWYDRKHQRRRSSFETEQVISSRTRKMQLSLSWAVFVCLFVWQCMLEDAIHEFVQDNTFSCHITTLMFVCCWIIDVNGLVRTAWGNMLTLSFDKS